MREEEKNGGSFFFFIFFLLWEEILFLVSGRIGERRGRNEYSFGGNSRIVLRGSTEGRTGSTHPHLI